VKRRRRVEDIELRFNGQDLLSIPQIQNVFFGFYFEEFSFIVITNWFLTNFLIDI
jgi:hypothetical protein